MRIQVLDKGQRLQIQTWLRKLPRPKGLLRLVHVQVVLLGRGPVALALGTHQDQVVEVYLANEFLHQHLLVDLSEKCSQLSSEQLLQRGCQR